MSNQAKYQLFGVWSLFLTLLLYLVCRVVLLPIQHDEAATFFFYIQTGDFLPPNAHWDANNHVLNSLLSYISYRIFGNELWALRLPNILAFILFFWSSWGLSKQLKSIKVRWFFFLALTMSHYLFEFFGQTRGYGLSMGFFIFSIFISTHFISLFSIKKGLLLIFCLFLATSSNLTLLIPSFILVSYLFLSHLIQSTDKKKTILQLIGLAVVLLILFYPLVLFSFALKHGGALYYGGLGSFWEHTGKTLSLYFFDYYSQWIAIVLSIFFGIIILLFGYLFYKIGEIKKVVKFNFSFLFGWLFIGAIASIFGLRYLLNVNFPEDRAALYLFPFFIGTIAFLLDDFIVQTKKNLSFLIYPLIFFPLHFLYHINVSTTIFPMEDNPPTSFFKEVSRSNAGYQTYPPTVGGYHMQRLCWAYLNLKHGGKMTEMLVSNHIDTLSDFQIVNTKRQLPENFLSKYEKINKSPINDLTLYKRSKQHNYKLVASKDSISNWNHSDDEFMNLFSFSIPDSLLDKPFFVGITSTIDTHKHPFRSSIVISQKDDAGNEITQESFHLEWMRKMWQNQPNNFNAGMMIPVREETMKKIDVYLWNPKKNNFLISKGKIKLYVLD